eukprot:m.147140 g.147140  ORF g.147140 m.147140 type:complete len:564 (-) comp14171_c0_seq1:406-2097(-)
MIAPAQQGPANAPPVNIPADWATADRAALKVVVNALGGKRNGATEFWRDCVGGFVNGTPPAADSGFFRAGNDGTGLAILVGGQPPNLANLGGAPPPAGGAPPVPPAPAPVVVGPPALDPPHDSAARFSRATTAQESAERRALMEAAITDKHLQDAARVSDKTKRTVKEGDPTGLWQLCDTVQDTHGLRGVIQLLPNYHLETPLRHDEAGCNARITRLFRLLLSDSCKAELRASLMILRHDGSAQFPRIPLPSHLPPLPDQLSELSLAQLVHFLARFCTRRSASDEAEEAYHEFVCKGGDIVADLKRFSTVRESYINENVQPDSVHDHMHLMAAFGKAYPGAKMFVASRDAKRGDEQLPPLKLSPIAETIGILETFDAYSKKMGASSSGDKPNRRGNRRSNANSNSYSSNATYVDSMTRSAQSATQSTNKSSQTCRSVEKGIVCNYEQRMGRPCGFHCKSHDPDGKVVRPPPRRQTTEQTKGRLTGSQKVGHKADAKFKRFWDVNTATHVDLTSGRGCIHCAEQRKDNPDIFSHPTALCEGVREGQRKGGVWCLHHASFNCNHN